ncbi:MAG TPA: asparagine synthase (glutamine-hydrolyzing), partial [Lachnospiraceae bacterium]|nr:asparagine synthase (glutamine-hydrolyzing) [Lachnospiraceae bacterium]
MCSILGFCGQDSEYERIKEALKKTASRGPDASRIINTDNGWLGFNRLSIMGLTEAGMQPFLYGGKNTLMPSVTSDTEEIRMDGSCEIVLVCNGEIYGFRPVREELIKKGYTFASDSDCEILPALYREYGVEMFGMLDAEFALILYDAAENSYIAARDPIGIRPLYYGVTGAGTYVFASEPKNLVGLSDKIYPFPPGHYFKDGKFTEYRDMSRVVRVNNDDMDTISVKIHELLTEGVRKRLDSDAPVGFLLSGGLDSSLVCGIAARLSDKPLKTWAIGMDIDAIDLKYAKEVADYIHSEHHEVIISKRDVLNALEPVIEALGTYDITTIRASVGMYLVCKSIHESSDIRVIMTGEISDEIFGYKYTDFAPNAAEFQKEAEKRIRELHM